jgi:serine protease Do
MRFRTGVVALVLVIAALILAGVLSVRVEVNNPLTASAKPFWSEKAADTPLPPTFGVWVELAQAVKPGVVNVGAMSRGGGASPAEEFFRRFFEGMPERSPRRSLGSGFVISADGYVVTNSHVVRGADQIIVRFAELGERRARLVGSDAKIDIALLKVEESGLPVIPLGDSDRLAVGEPVMAIGNPFGLDQTVTTGIVSAKERFIGGQYDDFIQTDASINPGNSGGPLLDSRGAVVGINTAIFSQTGGSVGIGFAIPINLAKDVLGPLREHGRVTRGYLGVSVMPVTDDVVQELRLSSRHGAVVADVVPRSPAAGSGLQRGDVVLEFAGRGISSPRDLTRRVAATLPGTRISLVVVRDDGKRTLEVTIGELRERAERE